MIRFRLCTVALVSCIGVAGCSLWNRVEVCEQTPSQPIILNHHTEGNQKTGTPGSMVPLPGGNALVVFASEVPGRATDQAMEIRSVRLTNSGARLPNCARNDQADEVLIPVDPTNSQKQFHDSAYAAGPVGGGRTGLITYGAQEAGRPPELWGLFFASDGCPFVSSSERRKPFLIASTLPGEDLAGNSVVPIAGKTEDDFVVVWEELNPIKGFSAKARVVRMTPSGPVFLETVLAPDGGVAILPHVGEFIYSMATTRIGDDRVAVAVHYSNGQGDSNVRVWFFDDRLNSVERDAQVTEKIPRGEMMNGRDVTAAFDGRTLLVGWLQSDSAGHVSLYTRALDASGRPRGQAARLSTASGATDGFPTIMAWPDHGFLAAWRQESGSGNATGSRILGRRLDANGHPVFTGVSCGEEPIVIAHQPEGDRRQPTLGALGSNDVLAVWTDDSKSGADTSGTGVQGRIMSVSSLFVGKERPGGAPGPAPVDASVADIADAGAAADAVRQCAPTPGKVPGGGACLCTDDCETGGQCIEELPSGLPGGVCSKSCDKSHPDSCGPNGLCLGTAPNALCFPACKASAECGPFRVCRGGYCNPYCGSDADCRSGHCDPYRHFCTADGQSLSGLGLDKDCLRDDDCRSRMCSTVSHRCQSTCQPERPLCPENSVCVPFPDGDGGVCLFACLPDRTCRDPKLTCYTDPATGKNGCI